MDVGSIIIGFGGLSVAALSLYLSYKSRTSPYRELLYTKQVEGFSQIIDALTDFYNAAQIFIVNQGCKLDDQSRPALRLYVLEKSQTFHQKHHKWAIFMPEEFNKKLAEFVKMINGISAPAEIANQYPKDIIYANDPGKLIGDVYTKVVEVARKSLGIEPLSKETIKLIGSTKSDNQ